MVCLRRTGAPPVVSGTPVDAHTRLYVPPVPEFRIEAVHVPAGDTATLAPASGTAILLVVQGGGTMEVEGTEGEVIPGGMCYSTCHHGHRCVMGTALCRCIFTCSFIVLCFWARSCGPQVPYARHLVVVTYYRIEGVGVAGGAGVRIYVSLTCPHLPPTPKLGSIQFHVYPDAFPPRTVVGRCCDRRGTVLCAAGWRWQHAEERAL